MSDSNYPHIEFGADGVPVLSGTRTKVVEIVLDRLAHSWDAEEIRRQHPALSLAQIHSALAYYYDHQDEIDRDIDRRLQLVNGIKTDIGDSPLRLKLKAAGRLP